MKSGINKSTIFGIVLTLAAFGISAALYDKLPNLIPVHWGWRAKADSFWAKPWGIYLYPIMIGAMLLLKLVLPVISPRAFAIAPFARAFDILMSALMLFIAYAMGVVYAAELGVSLPVGRAVFCGAGVLLMVFGNFFGKTTRNFFVGIRTPWTLADDEVWSKTHRVAGWLLVLCGIVMIGVAIIDDHYEALLVALGVALVVPIIYSFVIGMRRERRAAPDQE